MSGEVSELNQAWDIYYLVSSLTQQKMDRYADGAVVGFQTVIEAIGNTAVD